MDAEPHATRTRTTEDRAAGSTPLRFVLSFTALNALSAGLVTSGLFFAARAGFGFGPLRNYGLGVLLGGGYTAGALLAARVVARARGRARPVLLAILLALAASTCWPILLPGDPRSLWLLAACYGPVVATLWPIVQSYVSGGRDGRDLRTAVGRFNLTWGSALVVGFGLLGPLLEQAPGPAIALLGALHLLSALLLPRFAPAPAAAVALGETDPDHSVLELRRVMQGLLPLTNVLAFTLTPFLPDAFARLGLPEAMRASFAVCWLLPRAIVFGVLGTWQGWHGRRGVAHVGAAALIGGFALALLAPWLDRSWLGIALEIAGLCAFGAGMATIYTAAFYYAQVAGRAGIAAGGRHEALLGAGATAGPLLGLATAGAVAAGVIPAAAFEPILTGAGVALALTLSARALARR